MPLASTSIATCAGKSNTILRQLLEIQLQRARRMLDDVSLWKKQIAVVSIPLVIFLVTLIMMAWHQNVSTKAQSRVMRSLAVKAQLYQVQAAITNSETAVRGYLVWRDPVYLAPYNQARIQLTPAMNALENSVRNNPEQTSATRALRAQVRIKMDAMRDMLANPDAASFMRNTTTQASFQSMQQIRKLLRDLEITEATLLSRRIREYENKLNQLNASLIILLLLAIFFALTASYSVSAGMVRRVHRLEEYARKVSRGQGAVFEDEGHDELGLLGRSVQMMTNNLLAREEALDQARTELQNANERLTSQLRETKAVNQELEAFSYSVSHDLRAPLRHVTGFAEMMQKNSQDLDPKNQRYLGIILSSVQQMGLVIDELLTFSRMGRTSLATQQVDLNEIVNQVMTDLSDMLKGRNIQWSIAQLPTVTGDRVMLKLVFQNLMDNAIKYSREKDPAVITIDVDHDEEPQWIKITIQDNGVGFDMKYIKKLFAVFQRLHSSEEYEGTGIGLATVRRILKRHGGNVTAQGEINNGATFTVYLPGES